MLKQLQDISIDPGAPSPKILSSDTDLYLFFYSAPEGSKLIKEVARRDIINDRGVAVIRFQRVLSYKSGQPNDETLSGHPLYKLGLKPYVAQYLEQSSWIEEVISIDKVHPYHKIEKFIGIKHYIFTFHDSTFECLARDYQVNYESESLMDVLNSKVYEMATKEV